MHVVGTELYDENGKLVMLRGPSTHGLTWYPQYVNKKLFHQMAKEYANVPSVYTFEILDFGENKDEYIQMLYDRTPTLPQRLRLGDGYIRNFWKNFGNRIAVK